MRSSLLAFTMFLAAAAPVSAQCMQPNGTPIPTASGCRGGETTGLLATFACVCDVPDVCNVGDRCDPGLPDPYCPDTGMNATCESRMWHSPNDDPCIPRNSDGLDPIADCSTEPQRFSPTCPLTFTVLSRGTALFQNAFGWYNVTGAPPTSDELYVMLDCNAAPDASVVLDLGSDPRYLGGEIGFFLVTPEHRVMRGTCADGDCCASIARYEAGVGYLYFSERDHNPEGDDYVHLLVYDSQQWERKFYFAWEDIYAAVNNDFTDLVTSVEGVECAGAGEPCDTGDLGACSSGVRRCESGTLSCVGIASPETEQCNGVDDDCDDGVDEDATCPETWEVCHSGRCVPNCTLSDEFVCSLGFECDAASGHCVETACRDVACAADEVCRAGDCAGECEGVVCPRGQLCFRDRCVDPCAGVSCASGNVCRGGICVPGCNRCNGISCGDGTVCMSDGSECVDPSCPSGCPPGTFCREGECVDACEGAVCPRGQACMNGLCVIPEDGRVDGGVVPRVDAGRLPDGGAFDAGSGVVMSPGCACRSTPRQPAPISALAVCIVLLAWRSRSRRR